MWLVCYNARRLLDSLTLLLTILGQCRCTSFSILQFLCDHHHFYWLTFLDKHYQHGLLMVPSHSDQNLGFIFDSFRVCPVIFLFRSTLYPIRVIFMSETFVKFVISFLFLQPQLLQIYLSPVILTIVLTLYFWRYTDHQYHLFILLRSQKIQLCIHSKYLWWHHLLCFNMCSVAGTDLYLW